MTNFDTTDSRFIVKLGQLTGLGLLAGLTLGSLVFFVWNWILVPVADTPPIISFWRTILRSTEVVAFLTLWRSIR